MGGNDAGDSLRSRISTHQLSKKWWKALFFFVIDLALVATFKIKQKIDGKGKSYTIRRAVTNLIEQMIFPFQIQRKKRKVLSTTPQISHLPVKLEKHRRCVNCYNTKVGKERRKMSAMWCPDCDITLCLNCYSDYHTQNS